MPHKANTKYVFHSFSRILHCVYFIGLQCAWWEKHGNTGTKKVCAGAIASYLHRRFGEVLICARHVCSDRSNGCRIVSRKTGYQCSACTRTEEGKERIREKDRERK